MPKTKYSRECVERLSEALDRRGWFLSGRGCDFLGEAGGPERALIIAVREIADSNDLSKTNFTEDIVIELNHGAMKILLKQKLILEAHQQGRLEEFLETEVAIAKISK